jgi:hypothetical protein
MNDLLMSDQLLYQRILDSFPKYVSELLSMLRGWRRVKVNTESVTPSNAVSKPRKILTLKRKVNIQK